MEDRVIDHIAEMISRISMVVGLALLSLALVTPAVAAQSSGATHYVVYNINVTSPNDTLSATVNETVGGISSSGLSPVTLQIISSGGNLTYSKLVNSSYSLLPILPSLGTGSYHFTEYNTSISLSITQIGTKSSTFQGQSYNLTNYSFVVLLQGSQKSGSFSGQLFVFPSGLVYSALIDFNQTSTASAQLLSTNAPLGTTSAGSSSTAAIAITGGSLGAVAVGAFALVRRGRKESSSTNHEAKPLHWVD